MRKFFTILSIAAALSIEAYSQTDSSALLFDEKVFDFGEIEEKDGKVTHLFVLKNTGKEPVIIDEIVTGCGCTTAEYSKDLINPGQKSELTVIYNPMYRPGSFVKEITVIYNNRREISRIWIKGNVKPFIHPVEEDFPYDFGQGLHLSLKTLAYGNLKPGENRKIKLRFANDTNSPVVLEFVVEGGDKNLIFSNPGSLFPGQRGEVYFYYKIGSRQKGEKEFNLYPVLNGRKLEQPIRVSLTGV
jgi:hypothetical protein